MVTLLILYYLKVGRYEDNQITELVNYDEYWDKYGYYETHHDMYQELVYMWKMVFRKDSSSRPSANELLHQKWMKEMELSNDILFIMITSIYNCVTDGERILHELVGEEEQSCVEESYSMENENVGIQIDHTPVDNLSDHSFSQPGRTSPYQSNSPHLQPYPPSGGHSPAESDSDAYYDCNSSLSGRSGAYLFPSGPSSLPAALGSCVCV